MIIDIRDNVNIESFYGGFSEPTGYGAFDEDQLNERTEDVSDPCEKCDLEGLSECCNAPIKWTDICTRCGEHTESVCDNCNLK